MLQKPASQWNSVFLIKVKYYQASFCQRMIFNQNQLSIQVKYYWVLSLVTRLSNDDLQNKPNIAIKYPLIEQINKYFNKHNHLNLFRRLMLTAKFYIKQQQLNCINTMVFVNSYTIHRWTFFIFLRIKLLLVITEDIIISIHHKMSSKFQKIQSPNFPFLCFIYLKSILWIKNIFINKNTMSVSDNNPSALLLTFVNQQFQSEHPYFYDFEQLQNSCFIYSLLQKIHGRYFSKLNHLTYDFSSYLSKIEAYLMELQGKRLSRNYKKRVMAEKSVEDIIKLVMYLLLQSNNKTDYISRIVELSVEIQTFLMQEIKQISNSLQNFVEIKDIMIAIEKLQEQNEQLKEKLKAYSELNERLNETAMEIKQENMQIDQEIKKYEGQKKQIFEELHILDLKEYIEIYKSMKQENQELNSCIQEIQEKKKQIEIQNQTMLEKITQDCRLINSLNEEINNVRENYHHIKDQTTSCSFSQSRDKNQESILRENKNINNVKRQRHSIETTCSTRRQQILNLLNDEDDENSQARFYNLQVIQKLEQACKAINELTNEANQLRDVNTNLLKEHAFLDHKMNDLKKEQSRFAKDIKKICL